MFIIVISLLTFTIFDLKFMLKIQLAITSYLKEKIVSCMARKMLKWAFPDAENECFCMFVCIENSLQNSLCIEQFEAVNLTNRMIAEG